MKQVYKTFLLLFICAAFTFVRAQVSTYSFAQSTETFVPLNGGTVIATASSNTAPGNLQTAVWNLPNGTFPFPFLFNGQYYTGCNVSSCGFISFGSVSPIGVLNPIGSNTGYDGAISAFGLQTNGAFGINVFPNVLTSKVSIEVLGTAPNRIIAIQFLNWRYSAGTTTNTWLHDYQIRLYETSYVVEIMYGKGVLAGSSFTVSGLSAQVGLRGATNADFNNRYSTNLFNQSVAGNINSSAQAIAIVSNTGIFMPPNGLTYRWYPRCQNGANNTPTIAASPTLICQNDTLNLLASGDTSFFDMTYQWQFSSNSNGPFNSITNANRSTYKGPATTSGIVYYMLVSTCSTIPVSLLSGPITVTVKPSPVINISSNPPLVSNGSEFASCYGQTYTLTATGAYVYLWIGGPPGPSKVISPNSDTVYYVKGASVDACVAIDTVKIKVTPLPGITTMVSPYTPVCPGSPVAMAAMGDSYSYNWLNPPTNMFLVTVSPTVSTTYSVIGTGLNNCTVMATQVVSVVAASQVTASSSNGNSIACYGEQPVLSAQGANTYTWTTTNTYTLGQSISPVLQQTTVFTVTATDFNGCVTHAALTQTVQMCEGIKEQGSSISGVTLFPNPNTGIFTVELNASLAKGLQLIDLNGKIVYAISMPEEKTELNISELANGIYYLKIVFEDTIKVLKLVKQ